MTDFGFGTCSFWTEDKVVSEWIRMLLEQVYVVVGTRLGFGSAVWQGFGGDRDDGQGD